MALLIMKLAINTSKMRNKIKKKYNIPLDVLEIKFLNLT